MRCLPFVSLLTALVLTTGCMTEPFTGRKQFLLTSMASETKLGLQSWNEVLSTEKVSTDAKMNAAMQRVGNNLKQAANQPDFQWEFKVIASDQANAFCLPGGKVAVYSGLFKYVANDAELAAVVGHEIAHAVARHGGERMSQAMAVNFGASVVNLLLSKETSASQQRWMMAYTGVSTVGLLAYSRTHEYAADEIGLFYMARAGYDPKGAVDFWNKFSQANAGKGSPIGDFLSTHPLDSKRIAKLREIESKATLEYEIAPRRFGYGQQF